MWNISTEQLIFFPLVSFLYHCVTHDRVHCHRRWKCHFPLFASFANWINASLPNNAMVWLQRMSHLMPGDLFPFWKFEQQYTCNYSSWSWGSFGRIWHELMDIWAIIWLWWEKTCSIAVSFALKSVVDMLKMWVHKRTRAENNPTNHYQSKFRYIAMVIQTFKCNFSASCLITRHSSSIWITNDCIHCSLPSQLPKTCKKWDMTLSPSMAMYSVMRDSHDARMVPMERR